MKKIGIVGENYQNDAGALKEFLTPLYKGKIEFFQLGRGLNGGAPPINKLLNTIPIEVDKKNLDAVIFMLDLDYEAKRIERNLWFNTILKNVDFKSIFFLAVRQLEALILADIEIFNEKYGITGLYDKDPKLNDNPKKELERRTDRSTKARRKYDENHATEIFTELRFDIVYKKHNGEDSFQAFIDDFEDKFKIKPTTKERLKKDRLKQAKGKRR